MGNTFRGGQDRPHRKTVTVIGPSTKELPNLSFQCFESRHPECSGTVHSAVRFENTGPCECKCHKREVTEKECKDG